MRPYAITVEKSQNAKVGEASATYASQGSCPSACPLRGSGCYAESGHVGLITKRLTDATSKARVSPITIALEESAAIRKLSGERPLRVHVVGDCPTDKSAQIIGAAMRAHTAKHGQPAWTTTHAWRTVERASWGDVHVLASCETAEDVLAAQARGYATCIVVREHESRKLYDRDGILLLPCPAQTSGRTCVECQLCMNTGLLQWRGATIAFAAHGAQAKRAREKVS